MRRAVVGVIRRPFGVRGAVTVEDFSDGKFAPQTGDLVTLRSPTGAEEEVTIVRWRRARRSVIATFAPGVDRNTAEARRGWEIVVDETTLPPLPEGDYYHFELIGLTVATSAGDILGVVKGIYPAPAGDVLIVAGEAGEVEIPFVRSHVVEVRRGSRIIVAPFVRGD